ncbi:MAG: DUF1772 domain-containing protein [Acidimicrobiales bacterium]
MPAIVNTAPSVSSGPSVVPDRSGLARSATVVGIVATVFVAAIFGFFYAWVCSTMWGLGDADPRVAIEAMQAMNASVRNPVFFPAFFLTPVVLAAAGVVAWLTRSNRSAAWFLAASAVYLVGGVILTAAVNLPLNADLADTVVPASIDEARVIWDDYSGSWQIANISRTVTSGISLVLALIGLVSLRKPAADARPASPGLRTGA